MRNGTRPVCFQFRDSGVCSYGTSCKFSHGDPRYRVHHPDGKKVKFAYDNEGDLAEEFYRMCDFFAWDRKASARLEARQSFKDAMVLQFNSIYGIDTSDIENWHKLCVAVYIEPLPATIEECKEKIKDVYVNLVDLVDTSGRDVELFSSLGELRKYTIENGKFFPKESAYAGGVLKSLLREIF
ncbi:hypothetical protein K504DRAFT_423776 [Pleomassaria siparia CBS 279.74]|uniref:C3H1-type domain-containing protein n=1 Tax=Pleomassaria siparia CBS 279.74 TaxID=1314801 RepID=A0A6G1KLC5_9PLEO|nr:hypothetical protein K504DRAFT_423776 [Pleomassaria siparia CBS 279.74]